MITDRFDLRTSHFVLSDHEWHTTQLVGSVPKSLRTPRKHFQEFVKLSSRPLNTWPLYDACCLQPEVTELNAQKKLWYAIENASFFLQDRKHVSNYLCNKMESQPPW